MAILHRDPRDEDLLTWPAASRIWQLEPKWLEPKWLRSVKEEEDEDDQDEEQEDEDPLQLLRMASWDPLMLCRGGPIRDAFFLLAISGLK